MINPTHSLKARNPTGTLANNEDLDEMPHFIRVCTVCLDKIDLQRNEYNFVGGYDLSIYTMDHPMCIV